MPLLQVTGVLSGVDGSLSGFGIPLHGGWNGSVVWFLEEISVPSKYVAISHM